MIRKMNNFVVLKKIQFDTLLGTLFTLMLIYFMFNPVLIGTHIRQYIFLGVAVVVIMINIFNDLTDRTSKYALLDSVLFYMLLIYYSNSIKLVLQAFVDQYNSAYGVVNAYFANTQDFIPIEVGGYFHNIKYFNENFLVWMFFVFLITSTYGFMLRHDSRAGSSHKRTSMFSMLETLTWANSADTSRSTGLTPETKTELIKETMLKDQFQEHLKETQEIEERAEKEY